MSVVANVAINVDSRGATQKLREVQNQAQQTERAFGGLNSAVGKLVGAFAAAQAVRFVFVQAAEIQTQTRSLEVLTGSVQKATQIVKELQDLGAVTPFTSSELIDAAKRLQAFGVETNKVVDTTRRLADVSGATGAELQGLVTAYGQVQAKGRLQGEELLQFQERGVALQKVLKDEYKLSGEEFQDALEKGRISAQAVEAAIIKLTDAGGKYANGAIAQSDTLNGKLSTLQDSFQRLAQNIGTFFEPVFKFLIDGVNALIERLNNAGRIGAEARAYEEANRRTRTRFGALRYANPFDQEVQQYRERLTKSLVASQMGGGATVASPRMTVPAGFPDLMAAQSKAKRGKSDAEKAAEKAAREAERLAKLSKEQLSTAQQSYVLAEAGLAVSVAVTDNEKLQAEYDRQRAERMFKYSELLGKALTDKEREFIVTTQEFEVRKAEFDLNKDLYDLQLKQSELLNRQTPIAAAQQEIELLAAKIQGKEQEYLLQKQINDLITQGVSPEDAQGVILTIQDLEKQNKAIQDQKQLWADIYTTVSGELQNALTGLIDGTTKWGDVLSGILNSLGSLFLNAAFSGLGGALKLPGFASGGFVTGPTTAMIGEGGEPEYVIPASKMRSAMARYSAGARGSSVISGGSSDGATMGATMTAAPIDVRYTVERINSVDYVTADQFQAGMRQAASQGAERGQQLALRRLQQSPSARRRVGI